MSQGITRHLVILVAGLGLACSDRKSGTVSEGDVDEPARWHFERVDHLQGDMTLTDVWGRPDGAVFVVGWYGTIFTNRITTKNPEGLWRAMDSGTTEHLTGIWGVENGEQFGQEARDGEMFAVGWNGTLLHYHPNPQNKANPEPEDGRWQLIAGPGRGFTPVTKVDPFCPDYDGDGILDDSGGDPANPQSPDGWWSRQAACTGGNYTNCDDNCRTTPNGTQRPIVDNGNFTQPGYNCLLWGDDGPNISANPPQDDPDGNGKGTACTNQLGEPEDLSFEPTLFDVWATVPSDSTQLMVLAIGEHGALVTYAGPNAAQSVTPPMLPVTDRAAWLAQESLAYYYSNDCTFLGGAAPGTSCPGSGRTPPSCPAQCNVYKTQCDCPPANGACCVAGSGAALTGAACAGPGCSASPVEDRSGMAADNACGTPVAGECSELCPYCFRRLDKTLRSIIADGSTAVAVGASGTIVTLDISSGNPSGVWVRPDCGVQTPSPLDQRPLLTSVGYWRNTSNFYAVGAGGVVASINPGVTGATGCGLETRCAVTPAFLAGVFVTGQDDAYIVGDRGTLLDVNGADCSVVDNDVAENVNGIWVTHADGVTRLWLVGATGAMVKAGYF